MSMEMCPFVIVVNWQQYCSCRMSHAIKNISWTEFGTNSLEVLAFALSKSMCLVLTVKSHIDHKHSPLQSMRFHLSIHLWSEYSQDQPQCLLKILKHSKAWLQNVSPVLYSFILCLTYFNVHMYVFFTVLHLQSKNLSIHPSII